MFVAFINCNSCEVLKVHPLYDREAECTVGGLRGPGSLDHCQQSQCTSACLERISEISAAIETNKQKANQIALIALY